MKINYSILWLDDKKSDIIEDNYAEELQDFIFNEGFEPTINLVSNEEEFFKNLNDSYDLILTDYHLNESGESARDGDKIIEEVREKNVYTEIMFYSAQGDVADTIKKDRITFVDTRKITGTVHYEKIIEKAKELFLLTVKKFQHIVPMRGLLIQEASNLENDMLEIIVKYLQKKDSQNVKDAIYTSLISFYGEKHRKATDYKDKNSIGKILKDPLLISSAQRAIAISQILDDEGVENFIEELKNDIIKMRNEFAHAKYVKDEETGNESFITKSGELIFDAELCKKIRLDLIKHKKNITDLDIHIESL
ncbi:hypothetical protein [Chryseobacterium sp. FH1]|uniref:hypothetical protein n=1 Tax=Chryseobacterium sp. FH1 TaxID=1233951 RepID=UPI0004E3BE17|nr:hypothetical protein [Chryseobacterium sp. FH1]KFC19314.1 hypothetical protein IO90_08375 [Chryseobacterium sp. FH1]